MNWQLPDLRTGYLASGDLAERRKLAARAGGATPAGISIEEIGIEGVRCLAVGSEPVVSDLIYLHGGGYRMGTPEGWVPLASALAGSLGCRVILPDYRLAPEHPFPAGLIDAVAVYAFIREAFSLPVLLAGDSAGGGLAAALTIGCTLNGNPVPDGLILLSPWLDLTLSGETFSSRSSTDRFFPPESAAQAADSYLQGHSATDPLVSPLFGDLSAFPPTLIFAGTEEILLDDAVRFAKRLADERRAVSLEVMAGMQHAWPITSPDLPESSLTIEVIRQFVGRFLPSVG